MSRSSLVIDWEKKTAQPAKSAAAAAAAAMSSVPIAEGVNAKVGRGGGVRGADRGRKAAWAGRGGNGRNTKKKHILGVYGKQYEE